MELSSTHRKLIEKKKNCLNHHCLHVLLTVSTKFDKWMWFTETLKEKEKEIANNKNSNNKRRVKIKH